MKLMELLHDVRRPGRYIGGEVNAVRKDPARSVGRMVLAYPDLYELGMSYLGLQVLYWLVNDQPDLWAERVFTPDKDMERQLRSSGLPLTSLESRTPLNEFDVVGFTLQHELTYPDVLAMLQMGRIPYRASERTEAHPIVIAGGPCASNPEPLADALDAVHLGDAEPALARIVRTVGRARRQGRARRAILDELMEIPGVYVPSRYRLVYCDNGRLAAVEPRAGAPARVRRALLSDLNAAAPPDRPVVPFVEAVHDRLVVEIQRGCTRGCRFCQAGMINRPVRQRSLDHVLAAVDRGLASTGHDQVSFLSLSAGDHPQLLAMLQGFFQAHASRRISASLPSLRAETLTPALAALVRTVRKSGFTIAPEAGSARLRRVINKDLTDTNVIQAALNAFSAGWRLLKLYFMVGLPTETEADRDAIVELVERVRNELVAAGHGPRINVGISTFVPKAHTPFQFEAMVDRSSAGRINRHLRERLDRLRGVKTGFTRPEPSWAEGLLARGDRRQFESLLRLARDGHRLAGWSEHFDPGAFERAFENQDFYLRERDPDEILPWDHLDLGPSREFLLAERERAHAERVSADCASSDSQACADCGACTQEIAPVLAAAVDRAGPTGLPGATEESPPASGRVRLRLAKQGAAAHLSHLEFTTAVFRALRRAGWPLVHTAGFHPKPRVSFGPACPVGVESLTEMLDVSLRRPWDLDRLLECLRAELTDGLTLVSGRELDPAQPGIMAGLASMRYRIRLGLDADRSVAEQACQRLLARASWPVARKVKGRNKTVDVRPSLLSLRIEDGPEGLTAVLELTRTAGSTARPAEVAKEVFGIESARVVREELLFLRGPEGRTHAIEENREAQS